MEVNGSWKGSHGGGNLKSSTWRNNPQYLLVGTGDKVTLSLEVKEKDKKAGIGLYVLKADRDGHLLFSSNEGNSLVVASSNFIKETLTASLEVELSKGVKYVIIPCWNVTKKRGDFTLKSSHGKLEKITNDYKIIVISGQWDKGTAGGPKTSSTFSQNVNYFIHVPKKSKNVIMILSREEDKLFNGKIGFYVAKSEDGTTPVKSNANFLIEVPFSDALEVSITKDLDAGYYAIIPVTNNPSLYAKWNFLLYSDQRITNVNTEFKDSPKASKRKSGKSAGTSPNSTRKAQSARRAKTVSRDSDKNEAVDKLIKDECDKLSLTHEAEKKKWEEERKGWDDEKKKWESEKQNVESEKQKLEAQIKDLQTQSEKNIGDSKKLESLHKSSQEKVSQLESENKKLIEELNDLKKRKNEREDQLFKELQEAKEELKKISKAEEEEEDSMDWKMPIVTTLKRGQKIDIAGEWKGKSAGGCLNHLSWRHNPQILLTVTQNTNAEITLYQPKAQQQSRHNINFYVFSTWTDGKRLVLPYKEENVISESSFSSKKPTNIKVEVTLAQSKVPYVIIPCTYIPHDESKWILSIKADKPVAAQLTSQNEEWPTFEGEWKGETAAGCTNFRTFVNNPQYLLQVTKHTKFHFHLLQEEIPHEAFDTISIYVLKVDDALTQNLLEYSTSMEISHADFKNPNEVVLQVELQPGYYVIVPSTFNPGQEAKYQLRIISNYPPASFVELKPRKWITAKGEWKGETAGGSINSRDTWPNNPQFALTVKKKLQLCIALTQELPESSKANGIGFWIFRGGKRLPAPTPSLVVLKGDYRPDRRVKEQTTLEASQEPYVIVPTTFEKGTECPFTIAVTSEDLTFADNVKLEILPK